MRDRNNERVERIRRSLQEQPLDLVVCALPLNVVMLSGYWPVVGTSLVIASKDGHLGLLVPKDEEDLGQRGWADEAITFHPGSLDKITTPAEAIRGPLQDLLSKMGAAPAHIGLERDEASEPASYAAMHLYGEMLKKLLGDIFPSASLASADDLLRQLRTLKTLDETNRIRIACGFAERAFREGKRQLRPGLTEVEAAALFRGPLSAALPDFPEVERADGFVFCMSGSNSALASGAYARSRAKRIEAGDLVLVHCNSYADGYWTDITRTYCIGALHERQRAMYTAVFAARDAALRAISQGIKAAEIDRAARDILSAHGFGPQFKHSTGHGIGFSAINPNARPRLHPKSQDTVESGMVFNVEPAIYIDGYGGVRHCDMMAVTENGAELLTPFQCRVEELLVDGQ
ncbi:MAG: M24 family metallopeptidase [Terriglobia bacterium]